MLRRIAPLVLDQGFSSAAAFLFSVVLARSVGLEDYSLFAQAMSISVIGIAIIQSAYLEPRQFKVAAGLIQQADLRQDAKILALASLCVFLGVFIWKNFETALAITIFLMGAITLFTIRRYLAFEKRSISLAFLGAGVLFSTVLLLVVFLDSGISVLVWLALYGAVSFLAAMFFVRRVYAHELVAMQGKGGLDKLSLLIAIIAWLQTNYFYFYLPCVGLDKVSGETRAIVNLLMPAMQFVTLLNVMFLSGLNKYICDSVFKVGFFKNFLAPNIFISVLYGGVLMMIGDHIFPMLYKDAVPSLSFLFGAWLLLALNLSGSLSIALRGVKKTHIVVVAQTVGLFAMVCGAAVVTLSVVSVLALVAGAYSISVLIMLREVWGQSEA